MADEKKVKLTLKVAMNQADLGPDAPAGAAVGDEVEVDADTAERWIAAGIAEKSGDKPASKPPEDPKPSSGPTGRR